MRRFGAVVVVAILFAVGTVWAGEKSRIELTVSGLANQNGDIRCALYVKANYMSDERTAAVLGRYEGNTAVCRFENVRPGTYVIAVHHDQNGDGEMETNFVGIPKEGYAITRDASGTFGPPDFEDAAFRYEAGLKRLRARMRY